LRKPVSSRSPVLYRISVGVRRMIRRLVRLTSGDKLAVTIADSTLPCSITEHRSLLLRKLAGTDLDLQRNKVKTLREACSKVNGVLIHPGETFSFWRLIGNPTAGRGFYPGLQLSFGETVERVGGGLCQLSNLLHWMVLHTPMTVTERHRHAFDPFPDYRRTVPFGSGATVFYNYLDLMFKNRTPETFQILLRIGDEYLEGEIRSMTEPEMVISVEERRHRFVRRGDAVYRENELWKLESPFHGGDAREELLFLNSAEVQYDTSAMPEVEVVAEK